MTKDHIIPVSQGGKDKLDNLQPMCVICNNKKGDSLSSDEMLVQIALRTRYRLFLWLLKGQKNFAITEFEVKDGFLNFTESVTGKKWGFRLGNISHYSIEEVK